MSNKTFKKYNSIDNDEDEEEEVYSNQLSDDESIIIQATDLINNISNYSLSSSYEDSSSKHFSTTTNSSSSTTKTEDSTDALAYYQGGLIHYKKGNFRAAFLSFSHAIKLQPDHHLSLYYLGRMHHHGNEYVPRDLKKAFLFYKSSANYGNVEHAPYVLGLFYYQGLGDVVPKDNIQALFWFLKAKDHAGAEYNIGSLYHHGNGGVTKNDAEAYTWFLKSAEKSNIQAQYAISLFYKLGLGDVKKNHNQSFLWNLKAAENGHVQAQYNTGHAYQRGLGIPQDYKSALIWYERAVSLPISKYNIALFYRDGLGGLERDEKEAFKYFSQAAQEGHVNAGYCVGMIYHHGEEQERDYRKALYWYSKAAEETGGYQVDARFNMANLYTSGGYGIKKNYQQALVWYRGVAENDNECTAQYNVGLLYHQGGFGIKRDLVEAFKWYQRASENGGLHEAQYSMAILYSQGRGGITQDHNQALYWYTKAAENGNHEAQYKTGQFYYHGYRVQQDYQQAFFWFKKAAESGQTNAQYHVALIYHNGHGIEENYTEALSWYKEAAKNGHTDAQYNAACLLHSGGNGIEQDYQQSLYWYRQAAMECGHTDAQFNLALLYRNGLGTKQDYNQAIFWYTQAAEIGHPDAQLQIGLLYQNKEQNYLEAKKWYTLATENGEKTGGAWYQMGIMYQNGLGLARKNYQKALEYFLKSATEFKNEDAYNAMGHVYKMGQGVSPNITESFKWYKKSAKSGNAQGQLNLGKMYLDGLGTERDEAVAIEWFLKALSNGCDEAQSYIVHQYPKINSNDSEKTVVEQPRTMYYKPNEKEPTIQQPIRQVRRENKQAVDKMAIIMAQLELQTKQIKQLTEVVKKYEQVPPSRPRSIIPTQEDMAEILLNTITIYKPNEILSRDNTIASRNNEKKRIKFLKN